jgi:hypothetical protein
MCGDVAGMKDFTNQLRQTVPTVITGLSTILPEKIISHTLP